MKKLPEDTKTGGKYIKGYNIIIAIMGLTIIFMGVFSWFYLKNRNPAEVFDWISGSSNPKPLYVITGSKKSSLNKPLGVTTDGYGNSYVADSANNRIMVFDPNGEFVKEIGKFGKGNGQLNYPTGVALGKNNKLYVADLYNNRIVVFDTDGNYIQNIPSVNKSNKSIRPVALVTDNSGNLYVNDLANQQVVIFNDKLEEIKRFGEPGNKPGQFSYPNGIAIDEENKQIFVADSGNARVQVFDFNGKFLFKLVPVEGFTAPRGIAFDKDTKMLFVVDSISHQVYVFDEKKAEKYSFGALGQGKDQFYFPIGIALDQHGRAYIADKENNRVVVYKY